MSPHRPIAMILALFVFVWVFEPWWQAIGLVNPYWVGFIIGVFTLLLHYPPWKVNQMVNRSTNGSQKRRLEGPEIPKYRYARGEIDDTELESEIENQLEGPGVLIVRDGEAA